MVNSEEQWQEAGECACGAPAYRMGNKTQCPNCSCKMDAIITKINLPDRWLSRKETPADIVRRYLNGRSNKSA